MAFKQQKLLHFIVLCSSGCCIKHVCFMFCGFMSMLSCVGLLTFITYSKSIVTLMMLLGFIFSVWMDVTWNDWGFWFNQRTIHWYCVSKTQCWLHWAGSIDHSEIWKSQEEFGLIHGLYNRSEQWLVGFSVVKGGAACFCFKDTIRLLWSTQRIPSEVQPR